MPWYIKTERFHAPGQDMGQHLAAHRHWVLQQQQQGQAMVSGYLVDDHGQPGGGGLLVLEAETHGAAMALVQQDPMVLSGCVDWRLQGWIPVVGDLGLRHRSTQPPGADCRRC